MKLTDHETSVRVDDEERHETRGEVGRGVQISEEEGPELRRHRCHNRVFDHQRSTLRDLNTFVHVNTGVPATQNVLGGRHVGEDERGASDQREGDERATGGTRCVRRQTEFPSDDDGTQSADRGIEPEESVEAIPPSGSQGETHDRGQSETENDVPEDPFLSREPCTRFAPGERESKDD